MWLANEVEPPHGAIDDAAAERIVDLPGDAVRDVVSRDVSSPPVVRGGDDEPVTAGEGGGESANGRFYTIERAATILDTTPGALRAQLQRRVAKEGLTAAGIDLGGGIVAYKLGKRWRVWIATR